MTLALPANSVGSDIELILRIRLFIYNMNNRGPGVDPWGTLCFNVTQSDKKF
jgi:hypothetical protein